VAKRFRDSDLRNKAWYRDLGPRGRDLWDYLHDACDAAGLLDVDFKRIRFDLGSDYTKADVDWVLAGKGIWFSELRLFLPAFIEFQYGRLSESCKPHISIIRLLRKRGIDPETLSLVKGYPKGIQTLEEKEQEQDKEQEKEKDKEKEAPPIKRQPPSPATPGVDPSHIHACKKTWAETLRHFKCERNLTAAEELIIYRAIKAEGVESVDLALYGARFEPSFEGFNPKDHVDLVRVLTPDKENKPRIQKFMGFGAKAKNQEKATAQKQEAKQASEGEFEYADPERVKQLLAKSGFGRRMGA
jgi:hypothetical protein